MKSLRVISVVLFLLFCSALESARAAGESDWKVKTEITLPAKATALGYSPDSALIAVGHADGNVTVWEIKTSRLIKTLEAHSAVVKTVQFASGGSLFVTVGGDKRARLWSTTD